ncbi:hypothetical protein [Brachyspira murdochii]|uniref:Uncharacterized protein n=1 Tax=Brachyspira murdochii TaxID=84378 RepID=A0ABX5B7N9_9SPIR|nr:hypothetical protein [Brachyspira murdochii]PPS22632.1 hypothetical protein DJ52_03575 [Brachyspira murdochii]
MKKLKILQLLKKLLLKKIAAETTLKEESKAIDLQKNKEEITNKKIDSIFDKKDDKVSDASENKISSRESLIKKDEEKKKREKI